MPGCADQEELTRVRLRARHKHVLTFGGGVPVGCVGLFATVPAARAVIELAWTEAYLAWTRPEHEVAGWWMYQVGQPIPGLSTAGRDLGVFD